LSRDASRATLAAMERERGQASSDYVAVLLVVVLALGGAGAVASRHGRGIAQAVDRQMLRALCVARGGDCEVDRRPCVVASSRVVDRTTVTVAVVRLGHDRVIVREERSDGTVAVTLYERTTPGLEVGLGLRAGLTVDGRSLGLGGDVRGVAALAFARSRTWVVHDPRAGDALIERLAHPRPALRRGRGARRLRPRDPPPLPPPAQTAGDHGFAVELGLTGAGLGVRLRSEDIAGARVEAATGRRTMYVRRANELMATFVRVRGEQLAHEQFAVTFDRSGRPVDLMVLRFGALTAAPDLPQRAQAVAGALDVPSGHGRSWSTEEHLDLTDGANLAAARAFLAQVVAPRPRLGQVVRVSGALRARLDAAAVVHASTYEVDARRTALTGSAAVGLRLAGSLEHSATTSRLLAAATRGIDGVWRTRTECVARA
jgi:hypothetical protein